MDLSGKMCVVTGASSGIGSQVARDLARAGGFVCAVARREERLEALVPALHGTGHSYFVADVGERSQVEALAQHVRDRHAKLDVLVNGAGFWGERRFDGPAAIADVEAVMRTNFLGAVYCTGELLPLLFQARPGNVINIASVAGRVALSGSPAYSASKFALAGWSEGLHFQLRRAGVNVSLIEPGPLPTEGFPQTGLVNNSVLRLALTSAAEVSDAVLATIKRPKMQRTVPKGYYLVSVARSLAPGLYARAQGRTWTASNQGRERL